MTGLETLPPEVWNAHLTPHLDRRDWNAIRVASKPFYRLSESTFITPPWPQRCHCGTATQSFSISHDGEYLAVGSSIGSIQIWSRRKGKIRCLRKKESLTTTSSSRGSRVHSSLTSSSTSSCETRLSQPMGSVVKFAPLGYLLASGHENRIFLQHVSDALVEKHTATNACQMLEIQCGHGTIYEVTYLAFSQDAIQLIARYGKMAYIWSNNATVQTMSHHSHAMPVNYIMSHQIPLSSSRCHMASSLCMNFLAVANASSSDDKGTIDVWNVKMISPCGNQRSVNNQMHRNDHSSCFSKIPAHPEQVIRGVEFVACNHRSGAETCSNHFLVSASLRGEIRFWKYCHHASGNQDDTATSKSPYMCIRLFQVTGKIFSLALSAPSLEFDPSNVRCKQQLHIPLSFAVGQARGHVRAWKINLVIEGGRQSYEGSVNDGNEANRSVGTGREACNCSIASENTTTGSERSNDKLQEILSVEIGLHMHHDNIKLLAFNPDGRNLIGSRAYDGRIWFYPSPYGQN